MWQEEPFLLDLIPSVWGEAAKPAWPPHLLPEINIVWYSRTEQIEGRGCEALAHNSITRSRGPAQLIVNKTRNASRAPAQLNSDHHFAGLSSARLNQWYWRPSCKASDVFCLLSIRSTLEFQCANGVVVGKSSSKGNKVKIKFSSYSVQWCNKTPGIWLLLSHR